ncbi:MAG: YheU family protein [Geobacter sp.]|nr:MAG: YheU family protein [Geobacter sp.]
MVTSETRTDYHEKGVDVPFDALSPETLRNLIEEFVTREWSELSDSGYSLEDKVEQVLRQLKEKKVKVVFDSISNTANIVVCR